MSLTLNDFKSRNMLKMNKLTIPSKDLEFTYANIMGGVKYDHSCNTGTDITIGSCPAATIEFQLENLNNLINDIAGQEIIWDYGALEDEENNTFQYFRMGVFIAQKPTKKSDTKLIVKCYDKMIKFDVIVDDWLNGLTFPITLKNYLISLCNYVGVELETTTFTNEGFIVKDNFLGTNVKGRDCLKFIGEVAGKFLVFNGQGKLTLDWYKEVDYGITNANYYPSITIQDYNVQPIDKLQVQVVENDIGVIVGTGTNAYRILNNPLLYAETDSEIRPTVQNIFDAIKGFTYTPYTVKVNPNPLLNIGDIFTITTGKGRVIKAVIMSRKMGGGLETYSATGNERLSVNESVHTSILALRGKTNTLDRTMEKNILRIDDVERGYNEISQTVDELAIEVAELELEGVATYYQVETPESPDAGDIWYNPGHDYTVDGLIMTVDEMIMTVDELVSTSSSLQRYNGTGWQLIEDTELLKDVANLNIRSDSIESRVSAAEGDIGELILTSTALSARIQDAENNVGELELTATGLSARISTAEGNIGALQLTSTQFGVRISDAEGNIGALQLTSTNLTLRVQNAELDIDNLQLNIGTLQVDINALTGRVDSIDLTVLDGIKLATDAAKLEFNSAGLTIKDGGFKILQGSTEIFKIESSGLLYLRGEFRTGLISIVNDRLTFARSTQWSGQPAGAILYIDSTYFNIDCYTNIPGVGRIRLRSTYSNITMEQNLILQSSGNIQLQGTTQLNNDVTLNTKITIGSCTIERDGQNMRILSATGYRVIIAPYQLELGSTSSIVMIRGRSYARKQFNSLGSNDYVLAEN